MLNVNDIQNYLSLCFKGGFEIDKEHLYSGFNNLSEKEKDDLIDQLLQIAKDNGKVDKLTELFPEFLNENIKVDFSNNNNYSIQTLTGNNIGAVIRNDLLNATEKVFIISPFVGGSKKESDNIDVINLVKELVKKEIQVNLFTNCDLNDHYSRKFFQSFIKDIDPIKKKYFMSWIDDFNPYNYLKFNIYNSNIEDELNLHSKIYIIDNKIAYMGSINFTNQAFNRNHENVTRFEKISQDFDSNKLDTISELTKLFSIFTKKYKTFNTNNMDLLGKVLYAR
ncbi:MAG: phospholipase D-like domain-containing protein [Leptotrichia hongkongensis]|nr:phospholipase D-like domain-containing protein [Leptotrichia hongkongensis]